MPRKKKNNQYWPREVDDYIIAYNTTDDVNEKAKIFERHLHYPFYKLSENIIHTFKFYYTDVDDVEDLKHKIIALVIEEKIDKFDPSKGAKSYSYFGTIIKRWLINYNNKNYKKLKKKGTFDEYEQDIQPPDEILHADALSLSQFFDEYIETMYEELDELFFKEKDKQIADAILKCFSHRSGLPVYKKKALYIFIREQVPDCKTPHLTRVIKILKDRYYDLYNSRYDTGLVYR
mgnify:CR=1 FL=1